MKPISSMIGSMLPEGLLMPLCSGLILFSLSLAASCSKNNKIDEKSSDDVTLSSLNTTTLISNRNINATTLGAIPGDGVDDTRAIQKAIDSVAASGGGTVWLDDGDYNVNADTSIKLRSNVTLSMTGHARLIADTSSNERYCVIKATNIQNARILGGRIVGDRDFHNGTTGEWGYGIAIKGCDHIRVVGTIINKCWGDGLVISKSNSNTSTNITVKGIISRDNRRQAISVINVDSLVIDSCELYNTSGALPEDGIDIEPDLQSGVVNIAENITITNCDIYSNGGNGVQVNQRGSNIVRNVTIQNNKIHGNIFSGYFQVGDNINFTNNWLWDNEYNHAYNTLCTNSVFEPNTYSAP